MDTIHGRIALVSGGSRGIGAASCLALARAGCDVAIGYNRSQTQAQALAEQIRQLGRRAVAIQADMAQTSAAQTLVSATESELGPVDVLLNNAGINPIYPIDDIDITRWNETLQINLMASFALSQCVIPGMQERGWGRLIMMSSVAAQLGGVIGPHYAASKAGQLGLMRSYARLLAGTGITPMQSHRH